MRTIAGLFLTAPLGLAQLPIATVQSPLTVARPASMPVVLPPAPTVGSDSCTSPTLVVGAGPHAYDTTGATTGPEGQSTANCTFYNQIGIDSDVWFEWVAPATGSFEVTTCGLASIDTKLAVYAGTASGTTCPTGAPAAGCNDDISYYSVPHKQSRVVFATTAGTHYLIQIGGHPGAPPFTTDPPAPQGPGQFRFDQVIAQPPFVRHDGSAETVFRMTSPVTDTVWLMAQGDATTGQRSVTAVKAAVGAVYAATQTGVQNGHAITLGVWEDPNDDGDPADAVLLSMFTGSVSLANTDMLAVYTLPTPVVVDRVFFVGASYSHGVNTGYPAPVDSSGCSNRPGQAAMGGNAGPVDFANLAANTFPVLGLSTTDALAWLMEADTVSLSTGTVFCTGDGVVPHTPCPCGNDSPTADAVGCLNSIGTGGKLRASGTASLATDTLVLTGTQMPSSSCLYFQGTSQLNLGNGISFGDGLRCVGGTVARLGTKTNVAGASQYPSGGDLPVSVKGSVGAPGTRHYQAWYRNAAAFCTASTFNLTNGLSIIWGP
jgi:hypothetical protein